MTKNAGLPERADRDAIDEQPPKNSAASPSNDTASSLRERFGRTELNLDELEEHTRAVIEKARALLAREAVDAVSPLPNN